jgi:hypothetical protein
MEQIELAFYLYSDDLEWRLAEVFRQVGKGVHMLHCPCLRIDVFRPSG